MSDLRIRAAVRAILRTPADEVLLVRFEFPDGAVRWALPGGGIDPGESPIDALRRELIEELGLRDVEIGPHVWNRLHIVPFFNGMFDGQREQVHLVELAEAFEPEPSHTWEQLRAEYVHELRWWRVDEIEAADDVVFVPRGLASRLRDLRRDGPPNPPIDVEV